MGHLDHLVGAGSSTGCLVSPSAPRAQQSQAFPSLIPRTPPHAQYPFLVSCFTAFVGLSPCQVKHELHGCLSDKQGFCLLGKPQCREP